MLRTLNMPNKMTIAMRRLYSTIKIKLKGSNTPSLSIGRSVPHGSAFSGLIFALCLAPILRTITNDPTIKSMRMRDNGIDACNTKEQYEEAKIHPMMRTWDKSVTYAIGTTIITKKAESIKRII